MHIVLIVHIVLLSLSLIASALLLVLHISGKSFSMSLLKLNTVGTAIGLAAGGILLIDKPFSMRCFMLLSYLVAFSALHLYLYRQKLAGNIRVEA